MVRPLVVAFLAAVNLFFASQAQAIVAAPAVTDSAYWAMQRTIGNIVTRTAVGDVVAGVVANPASRINPWITAVVIGATVWGVVADTSSSGQVEIYPSQTGICFDTRNVAYCNGSVRDPTYAPQGSGWLFQGSKYYATPLQACLAAPVGSVSVQFVTDTIYKCLTAGGSSLGEVRRYTGVTREPDTPPTTQPNGKPGVQPVPGGGGWTPSVSDGDQPPTLPTTSNQDLPRTWAHPGLFVREYTDTGGGMHRQAVTPLPDGGINLATQDEYVDPETGVRHTRTQSYTTSPDGKVIDTGMTDTEGGLPLPSGDPSANPGTTKIELETCGLPGKPACKIDETGTPVAADALTALASGKGTLDQSKTDALTKVAEAGGASGKNTGWTFSFAFPSGCSPYVVSGFKDITIDMCQYQPQIHDLMSMIWAATAVFFCIGMVGRTMRGAA